MIGKCILESRNFVAPKTPAWLFEAKPGDEVYLVKENIFCHIASEYFSFEEYGWGFIKLAEKEHEYIVRPDGGGVNFSLIMVPASCVLSEDELDVYDIIT